MTLKEQLFQELDHLSESTLQEVLEFVLSLKDKHPLESHEDKVWQAYLVSKREREEVYRRLADS